MSGGGGEEGEEEEVMGKKDLEITCWRGLNLFQHRQQSQLLWNS